MYHLSGNSQGFSFLYTAMDLVSHQRFIIRPKAIVFDWDGTLADTRSTVVACLSKILESYDLPSWESVKKARDLNQSLKDSFPVIFGDQWKAAYGRYVDLYLSVFKSKVHLFPGVRETLEWLAKSQVNLLVISNKEKAILLQESAYFLPNRPFWKLFGYGDASENKPSAKPVEAAFEHSDILVNSSNVWFVGDSLQDIECAYAANCLPIYIGNNQRLIMRCHEIKGFSFASFKGFSRFAKKRFAAGESK